MKSPKELRERAAECERVAEKATSPEVREILLYAAARWLALAEQDEAVKYPH
jgi:hypothetical protein